MTIGPGRRRLEGESGWMRTRFGEQAANGVPPLSSSWRMLSRAKTSRRGATGTAPRPIESPHLLPDLARPATLPPPERSRLLRRRLHCLTQPGIERIELVGVGWALRGSEDQGGQALGRRRTAGLVIEEDSEPEQRQI